MLLGGVNDSEAALHDIATVLEKVDPDEIHLSTPTRPPAERWIECPSRERTERAASILGQVAKVLPSANVEAVASIGGELVDAVLSIVARHPLKESEVESVLTSWLQGRVEEALKALSESGRIQIVERYGERFWCAAGLAFPNLDAERCSPAGPMPVSESP
jgi:wyosine [tRNA(Phe)-imidazoG37] synthetase (radical SAM superfamily)